MENVLQILAVREGATQGSADGARPPLRRLYWGVQEIHRQVTLRSLTAFFLYRFAIGER